MSRLVNMMSCDQHDSESFQAQRVKNQDILTHNRQPYDQLSLRCLWPRHLTVVLALSRRLVLLIRALEISELLSLMDALNLRSTPQNWDVHRHHCHTRSTGHATQVTASAPVTERGHTVKALYLDPAEGKLYIIDAPSGFLATDMARQMDQRRSTSKSYHPKDSAQCLWSRITSLLDLQRALS